MLRKLFTYSSILAIRLISLLPLQILYMLSDLIYPFVYFVVQYRRKVVSANLSGAFPGMGEAELRKTEMRFYRYLCDLIVETIKTGTIKLRTLSKRMLIRNPELVNDLFRKGKSVIVVTQHYGNWEWLIHIAHYLEEHAYIVYKPIENEIFEKYMNRVRERFGGETISMSLALRKMIEAKQKNLPVLMWLAADQAPPWNHQFWTTFLNRETMFFTGPAKLAHRFNHAVVFQQIRPIRRGYYETWFELITDNPGEMGIEEMMTTYIKMAESFIRKDPAYYLWSHRRWKYRRPENLPLY